MSYLQGFEKYFGGEDEKENIGQVNNHNGSCV